MSTEPTIATEFQRLLESLKSNPSSVIDTTKPTQIQFLQNQLLIDPPQIE